MSDVNVHISVGSGTNASSGAGSRGAAVQTTAEAEPARPMALEELQFGGGGEAPPRPLLPEELTTASVSSGGSSIPVPMAIEQLQGSVAAGAPEPSAFGSLLEAGAGLPTPSLELLGQAAESAPGPLSPEELGSPGTPGKTAKK